MLKIGSENIAVGIVEHGAKKGRAYRSSYWDRGNKIWSGLWSIYTFQENIPLFSCYLFSSSNRNGLGRDYAQKLVVNVCINPLTALLGVKNGELITNRFLSNDGASVSGGRISY